MILRIADEIQLEAATRITPLAWPILSLYLKQVNVLLLVTGSGEFCLWTFAAVMILTWNLSKNRSVEKDLYKCEGIRWLQRHSYWGKGGEKWMYLRTWLLQVLRLQWGKKETPVCTKIERQGRTFVVILRYEIDLRNIQIPFHFGVPPVLLLGQLE